MKPKVRDVLRKVVKVWKGFSIRNTRLFSMPDLNQACCSYIISALWSNIMIISSHSNVATPCRLTAFLNHVNIISGFNTSLRFFRISTKKNLSSLIIMTYLFLVIYSFLFSRKKSHSKNMTFFKYFFFHRICSSTFKCSHCLYKSKYSIVYYCNLKS